MDVGHTGLFVPSEKSTLLLGTASSSLQRFCKVRAVIGPARPKDNHREILLLPISPSDKTEENYQKAQVILGNYLKLLGNCGMGNESINNINVVENNRNRLNSKRSRCLELVKSSRNISDGGSSANNLDGGSNVNGLASTQTSVEVVDLSDDDTNNVEKNAVDDASSLRKLEICEISKNSLSDDEKCVSSTTEDTRNGILCIVNDSQQESNIVVDKSEKKIIVNRTLDLNDSITQDNDIILLSDNENESVLVNLPENVKVDEMENKQCCNSKNESDVNLSIGNSSPTAVEKNKDDSVLFSSILDDDSSSILHKKVKSSLKVKKHKRKLKSIKHRNNTYLINNQTTLNQNEFTKIDDVSKASSIISNNYVTEKDDDDDDDDDEECSVIEIDCSVDLADEVILISENESDNENNFESKMSKKKKRKLKLKEKRYKMKLLNQANKLSKEIQSKESNNLVNAANFTESSSNHNLTYNRPAHLGSVFSEINQSTLQPSTGNSSSVRHFLTDTTLNRKRSSPDNRECSNGKQPKLDVGSNVSIPEDSSTSQVGLRPIVIDACNVAFSHGRNVDFSFKGIKICVEYFKKRGHKVFAILPNFRKGMINDDSIINKWSKDGTLVFTPSRKVNGQLVVSHDDRFIIQTAAAIGAVIVSQDNYRDFLGTNQLWDEAIKNRLLMFTWVDGDLLMFPEDPLGRHGPSLNNFLKFPKKAPTSTNTSKTTPKKS